MSWSNQALLMMAALSFALSCNKEASKDEQTSTSQTSNPGNSSTGGTSAGVNTLQINGQLDKNVKADTAAVFTVSGGSLGNASPKSTTPITAGTLAVSVDQATLRISGDDDSKLETNVIAVFKKGETLLDTFDSIQFVSVPTTGDEDLLNLATSKLNSDNLELGNISADGDDLTSENKITSADLDLDQSAITEMAKTDDSLRILKNAYANTDNDGGTYTKMALGFFWKTDAKAAINSATDPASVTFTGWGPEIQSNRDELQFEVLCGAAKNRKSMVIKAPGDGVSKDDSATSAKITQFTNEDAKENEVPAISGRRDCLTSIGYIAQDNSGKQVFMNFGSEDTFKSAIPKGTWTIEVDNKTIGKFDLAVANPIDEKSGKSKLYVPSVKVTVDPTTDKVQKAELWWYLWDNATQSFTKVTDYYAMKQVVEYITLGFDFNVPGKSAELFYTPSDSSRKFPENGQPWVLDVAALSGGDWRMNANWIGGCPAPAEGFKRVDMIGVDFGMFGNRYKFQIRMPNQSTGTCP